MDVLVRLLLRLLFDAVQSRSTAQSRSTPAGRRESEPDTPESRRAAWESVGRSAALTRERLAALGSAVDSPVHDGLRPTVRAATAEAERLVERTEAARTHQSPPDARPARRQADSLSRRARALDVLIEQRCDPRSGALLAAADGLVAALGAPAESVVVVLHDDPARLVEGLGGSGLQLLALPVGAAHRPEPWGGLSRGAWGAGLASVSGLAEEASHRLEEGETAEDALDRLAVDVVAGWAPCLLADAAAVLSLGSAEILRAEGAGAVLDDTARRTVAVDGDGRVGPEPPPALRETFRRTLAQRLGLHVPPPLPGGPTRSAAGPAGRLLARGPGVLEWLPMDPFDRRVRDAVEPLVFDPLRALNGRALAELEGLRGTERVDRAGRDLAARVASGHEAKADDARVLLAAVARLGASESPTSEIRERALALLATGADLQPARRAAPGSSRARSRGGPAPRAGRRSRVRGPSLRGALREAVLLGAALSRPSGR